MPWPQGIYNPPSWQDRAEAFVSWKKSADVVEAEKFAARAGIPYDELAKVAEASGCSTPEALTGLMVYSCAMVKKASGLPLPPNEAVFLREMKKEAVTFGENVQEAGKTLVDWAKKHPEMVTRAVGAVIGAGAGAAATHAFAKRHGGKKSTWERYAEKSLAELNKKNPNPKTFVDKLMKARGEVSSSLARASAEHPGAATLTGALVGAFQAQDFAGSVAGSAKNKALLEKLKAFETAAARVV